jgi:hypothetical protein
MRCFAGNEGECFPGEEGRKSDSVTIGPGNVMPLHCAVC